MKQSLTCPRCAQRRIWYVPQVREHGFGGRPWPLGAVQGFEPFELFVCDACHYAEWYASAPQALQAHPERAVIGLAEYRLPCHGCGLHDHLLVAQLLEARPKPVPTTVATEYPIVRFSDKLAPAGGLGLATFYAAGVPLAVARAHGVADGSFALTLCRACGLGGWYACNFGGEGCEAAGAACPRCRGGDRVRVPFVEEDGGKRLPVVFGWRERGSFSLEVCRACGYTEWFAELRGVGAGADGVVLLDGGGDGPGAGGRERGPYR